MVLRFSLQGLKVYGADGEVGAGCWVPPCKGACWGCTTRDVAFRSGNLLCSHASANRLGPGVACTPGVPGPSQPPPCRRRRC